uniref:Uncharacterized protein n=1 Tax=Zymomonas mobilis TaxID=542 RepID=Q9X3Y1_ZYMMB|nr:unknown [Zymomonas mobilis subsp. mobilis ZM4 = ATCC 31821]
MIMGGSADIAGAARTCTDVIQGFFHGRNNIGILPHRQIVIGTPNRNWGRTIMTGETTGIGEMAFIPQNIDKHTIAAFFMQALNRLAENMFVIQRMTLLLTKEAFVTA